MVHAWIGDAPMRLLHQKMLAPKVALLSMPFLAETILTYCGKGSLLGVQLEALQ
jgi:hypothetical protein